MAAASYYHGGGQLDPGSQDSTELSSLPSPDPSYSRPLPQPAASQYEPLSTVEARPDPQKASGSKFLDRIPRKRFESLKRYFSIVQTTAQVVSTLLTGIMFGIMVFVNIKFYTTRGTVKEGRNPWPKGGTKVWPSFVLLVAAGVTLGISTVILLSYCCKFRRLQQSVKLTFGLYAVHIAVWIVISVIYRYEKSLHGNNDDLWGWSCSTQAANIQKLFDGVVDFRGLCRAQVGLCFFH